MRKFLFLVYILSTLACGLTAAPQPSAPPAPVTVTVTAAAAPVSAPLPTATLAAGATGKPVLMMTAKGDVNIRLEPSADSRVLGWLLEGQGIEVISIADGWAKTPRGYIKAEWLR
jgi:uncharacterized protein YgiM (DUF1202 family)